MHTTERAATGSSSAPTAAEPRRRHPARHAVALFAVLALLLSGCLSEEQQSAHDAMNKDRRAAGAATLSVQNDAQAKAQKWAEKLARENTLYHSKLSDGIGVRWCNLGENVGYGSSIPATEAAFMRSTVHKGNILNRVWNGVGVGVAHNGNRTFIVQVFIKTC
ncbi:CAP domain-containing protein [Aquihabitans sp. G128]|uniref:CAP domain-containing protein n=1 Tax=Aquihabitans sp. G128 TaxID=2849779 RepID=UPI001C225436|nr:CAP domain-containing protein [Aquihabitans sp. G128]QXC59436.1 CAP domain-containing protein [Aquihabitans sp. G128]